jgi:putative transposase
MGVAGRRRLHQQGAPRPQGAAGEPEATGRNPTARGKAGRKRHLLTEGRGVPLAVVRSGANRTDRTKLEALLDARLLEAPEEITEAHLCLDRGYDYPACRTAATARGYLVHIPRPPSQAQPVPPPGDPARHPARRWVVEVCHSWFNRFRRLLIRWEKQAATYLGFVQLAACLIIYRKLRHARSLSG